MSGLKVSTLTLKDSDPLPPKSALTAYDLIILDAPDILSMEKITTWLSEEPAELRPPILVVTYSGSFFSPLHTIPKLAWVKKPLRQSDLYRALADLLAGGESSLPLTRLSPGRSARSENQRSPIIPAGTVLIAEDNTVNQKIVVRMLSKLGYRCDVVANGGEAVAAVQRMRYSAILMDCQMPEMDGFEATAHIRHWETTSGGRAPIIAMTAHALKGDRERCHAAGMDDYLSKPIKLEGLERILHQWVRPPV